MQYKAHSVLALFPEVDGQAYEALKADIEKHGQQNEIVVHKRILIDGRARLRALHELGRKPLVRELDERDPATYIIAANLLRRHLDESMRAMIASQLATMGQGRPTKAQRGQAGESAEMSQAEAARLMSVGERAVRHARRVLESEDESLIKAVQTGQVAVTAASAFLRRPAPERRAAMAKVEAGMRLPAALRMVRSQVHAKPRGQVFETVVLDASWEELETLDLPLDDSGHVFLWLPRDNPKRALRLMDKWGLSYRAMFAHRRSLDDVADAGDKALPLPSLEFCVYAVRGDAELVEPRRWESMFEGRLEGKRPARFWEFVRTACPGTRLAAHERKIEGFETRRKTTVRRKRVPAQAAAHA